MNENTKLYVFAKKEVALIFIFMVLIAVSAFVLGVKIGKNYSYLQSGYTPEDRAKVDMLSTQEEQLQDITDKRMPVDPQKLKDETHKALEERLKEQLQKEEAPKVEMKSPEEESTTQVSGEDFNGKFTIQLGSHRSKKESEEFANGFKYRGYNPIINEVEISGRGTWYRTSLGVFSSIEEAKAYIKKEMELFRGQDYVIGRFE
ncbi:MAG: cell division protein FtsN [Bacteriovoracaceae bacterium]|jgi:cell division protein FtsN